MGGGAPCWSEEDNSHIGTRSKSTDTTLLNGIKRQKRRKGCKHDEEGEDGKSK